MISELASHIDKQKFDVRVICIYGEPESNEMECAVKQSGASLVFLGFKFTENRLNGISRVWKELSSFKPDVVHTHLGAVQYCLPWVIMHGVKLLHTVHSIPDKETPGVVLKKVMSWMYCSGRAIPVAISNQNRPLVAHYYGLSLNMVALVNNPVDVQFFRPPSTERPAIHKFDFINVAGLRPEKNQEMLLRAFAMVQAKHPKCKLCLVGDGTERKSLEKLAIDLGIAGSVVFTGQKSEKATIRELLWSSKVFVLSSDYEGLPLSVIEAMACGLPIISTDVGGMSDVVRGNGELVPPGDVKSLSKAMEVALDRGYEKCVSARSRELACLYGVEKCSSKYESIYEQCVISK